VVLVLRNPWDTLVSYQHYMAGEWGRDVTLADVVTSAKHGAAAVVWHAASYLDHCPELLVLTYEALRGPDIPLLQAIFLLFSIAVIGANLFAELLYVVIDPRVRE
jgi:hypothetical protein